MVWKVANHKVFVLFALSYKIICCDFFPFSMYGWEGDRNPVLGTGLCWLPDSLLASTQSHTCRPLSLLADWSISPCGLIEVFLFNFKLLCMFC